MSRSKRLFTAHQYDEALGAARKEASGRGSDDYKIGPALIVGRSLILLGKLAEAREHLETLAAARHCGVRLGQHFTYAGLASWFADDSDRALALWKKGLTTGHHAQEGMEIPWTLLYASARRRDSFPRQDAVRISTEHSKRLSQQASEHVINRFALGQIDEITAVAQLEILNEGRFKDRFMKRDQSRIDFFAGLHALGRSDETGFYDRMVSCASLTNYETIDVQLVIAECEINQGPAKWRRKLTELLAVGTHGDPKVRQKRANVRGKRR